MYRKDSPTTIQSMFNSIASRYDLTNAVLSFYLHKRWNRALNRHLLRSKPASPHHVLLDLCAGTGDIAFDYLRLVSTPCHAYLIDFSANMLDYAQSKAKRFPFCQLHTLSYIEADVQQLPLPDQMADHATIAYGIRNVEDPAACLKEVFRVLKPGGSLGILELTRPQTRLLRLGHHLYLKTLLPFLGKLFTHNQQAYEYLQHSIENFIEPQQLEKLLIQAGFTSTERYPLAGGIATILIGHK